MAIDIEAARMLLSSQRAGCSFENTVMLGRQTYLPGNRESERLLREYGHDPARFPELFQGEQGGRYAEPFFAVLGAKHVTSIDASDFERATLVHDLNLPVPRELVSKFDAVYDGGTLEHVFNFRTAITSCMEMVKVGGRLFLHTTANNYFGHGFYQYSPELFFRILSNPNGFVMERMVAMEYGPRRRWYEISDPEVIRARTPLVNSYPVLLFVQAKKTAEVPLFQQCPQQSDYSTMWNDLGGGGADVSVNRPVGAITRLKRTLVERTPGLARFLEAFLFSGYNRGFSFRNRTAFRPVSKKP